MLSSDKRQCTVTRFRFGGIEVAVVRSCAHSTVWNGVCTECGEPVTGGVQREARKLGREDAKYGEFELTNDQVGRLEREAEERSRASAA